MTSYPTRRSTRLRNYDYSQAGASFVTLCIERSLPLLGHIADEQMQLSPAGAMVATVWGNLARYYPVEVDAFVVMPNHVHGILVLGEARTETELQSLRRRYTLTTGEAGQRQAGRCRCRR